MITCFNRFGKDNGAAAPILLGKMSKHEDEENCDSLPTRGNQITITDKSVEPKSLKESSYHPMNAGFVI